MTINTRVIPKETNYQKWLNDYKIHCNSEDVIVSNIYKGYAVIDGDSVHSKCRTIYYDARRHILLAEDIESSTYLFIHGKMYVYEDVIYFESYNAFRSKKPLYDFVNAATEATQSGGSLEDGTIARVRTTLSPIFSTAVKKELLLKNPVMNATTPKDTDTEERAYLDAEHCKVLLTIINEFSNPQLTRLIRVLLFTGMRVGEITGLHWDDVDFEHSTLTVRYSIYRSKGQ